MLVVCLVVVVAAIGGGESSWLKIWMVELGEDGMVGV